tara:strand:+ start:7025 stop:7816 length:792 start_codon:yes stop_codon:yes gene_type:complete
MSRVDNVGGAGFTVDNGTGANVRTKLQQIIDALRTVQSGSGDPVVGLSPYQLSVNEVSNTSQLLKIRNKNNDDFITIGDVALENLGLLSKSGGTMTGAIKGIAGSRTATSFNFGQNNTGFFGGTGIIHFSLSGTQLGFLNSSAVNIISQLELRMFHQNMVNGKYIGFKAPQTVTNSTTFTLPDGDTSVAGYALVSDGNGNLSWGQTAAGAQGAGNDQIFWENDKTVTTNYSITSGKNAGSFGPITISPGVTVTVGSTNTWTVV